MGLEMGDWGVNEDGDGDEGMGFDHLGKAPPLCETKKVHKEQFWGTSAHSFRHGVHDLVFGVWECGWGYACGW